MGLLSRPPRQRAVITLLAAVALLHVGSPRALAECFGESDPWPSFREAIPSAQRIVVGQVVAPIGGSTGYLAAFDLRVTHVVRGPLVGSEHLEIVGLKSGLPLTICADSVATLLDGDVVAIAFDAVAPDGRTQINTLAYLRRAGESILTGVEDIDMLELVARAAAPGEQPDEVPRGDQPDEAPLFWLLATGVILLTAAVVGMYRRRRGPTGDLPT